MWIAVGVALLLAGAAAVVLVLTSGSPDPAPAPRASVEVSAPAPTPSQTEAETKVVIDDVRSMPFSDVLNPPDQGESFWQIVDPGKGYPQDGGTDYVLAHACKDRECVGDGIRGLEPEDTLTYRGESFVVREKLEINKSEIGNQDIWDHDPDRLVVITCILDEETGTFDENDILVAERVSD